MLHRSKSDNLWLEDAPVSHHGTRAFAGPQNMCPTANKKGRISPSLHVHGLSKREKCKNKLDSALSGACDPCMIVLKWVTRIVTFPSPLSICVPNFLFLAKPSSSACFSLFISWRTTCLKGELCPSWTRVCSRWKKSVILRMVLLQSNN